MRALDWLMLAGGVAVAVGMLWLLGWTVRRDVLWKLEEEQLEREAALELAASTAAVEKIRLELKLEELRRAKVRVRDEEPMSDGELQMALSGLSDKHPAWRALNQLLEDQIWNAVCQVSIPAMATDPGAMAHTAGGIEWLRTFQTELMEVRSGSWQERKDQQAKITQQMRRAA